MTPDGAPDEPDQGPTDPGRQVTTMRSTHRIARFVTAYVGSASQVIVLGGPAACPRARESTGAATPSERRL